MQQGSIFLHGSIELSFSTLSFQNLPNFSLRCNISSEQGVLAKIHKLNHPKDYLHWRQRIHAYIRRNDFEMLGFTKDPTTGTTAVWNKWFEAMIKAKSAIVLSLGSAPLAKMKELVDDDASTAK